ncbi:MAG: class I SAM-dependent methyltransferase [Rickettsia endosymbiont of Bryobia graminum]|nr:class I SAM-dependent methyltransferase [Rickettsia endosymbiont of Bryobia graminum]
MPEQDDTDWQKWLKIYSDAYHNTQRVSNIASLVNNAGYKILDRVNLKGLKIAEIGPGGGFHFQKFMGIPTEYTAIDVLPEFLEKLGDKVSELGSRFIPITVEPYKATIALDSQSQDIVLLFYSLEHLHPLESWVDEILRVLKPGGLIVGAIPAEGGLAWGSGRFLTSRRIVKKLYNLDLDKIVCWEHPNYSDEILQCLDNKAIKIVNDKWPLGFMPLDLSLVVKFIYKKANLNS